MTVMASSIDEAFSDLRNTVPLGEGYARFTLFILVRNLEAPMGLRTYMDNPTGSRARCQNCDWTGLATLCKGIEHFDQRVAAGEPCPAGECPKCGALCRLIKVRPRPKVAATV